MAAKENSSRPVAMVTGASAGVGRAVACAFAHRGYRLGLIARGRERLEATQREVEELGGEALVLPLDVADAQAVEQAAETLVQTFGRLDVWVNNAMVTVFSPIDELLPEEFRRVTEVNYLGYVHGTLAALRRMLPANKGTIVQVGSALAYRAIPLQAPYCASKFAIRGFTDSLRCELLHRGSEVKLTMVQLPALNTPQFDWLKSRLPRRAQPVPPIFQPEVAAEAIVWAAEHPRREVVVGASSFQAIWGNKVAPGVADRYLARRGYASQMTDEPEDPARPSNLWEPVPGDYGAHGRFDERAKPRSLVTWASLHRAMLGAAAAAAAVGAASFGVALIRRKSRR